MKLGPLERDLGTVGPLPPAAVPVMGARTNMHGAWEQVWGCWASCAPLAGCWHGPSRAFSPAHLLLCCGKAGAGLRASFPERGASCRHAPWVAGKGIARPRPGAVAGPARPSSLPPSLPGRGRCAGVGLAVTRPRRPTPLTRRNYRHARRGAPAEAHARNRPVGHRREPAPPSPHRLVGTRLRPTLGARAPAALPVDFGELVSHVRTHHPDALHREDWGAFL